MDKDQAARRFKALYVRALTDADAGKSKPQSQRQRDYEQVDHFVNDLTRAKDVLSLAACIDEYLKIYRRYSPDDRRSKLAFVHLLDSRIELSTSEESYSAKLSVELSSSQQPFTAIRQRFEGLEDDQKRQLLKALKFQEMLRNQHATIFDELQAAYDSSVRSPKTSISQLYALNPLQNTTLENILRSRLADCSKSWATCEKQLSQDNWAAFSKKFIAFTDFLNENRNEKLKLFQILKWCRDPIMAKAKTVRYKGRSHVESIKTVRSPLEIEFYFQVVYAIYLRAILMVNPVRYQTGFPASEIGFFLDPLVANYYFPNYQNRLRQGSPNAASFPGASLSFLWLWLFSKSKNLWLINDQKFIEIAKIYDAVIKASGKTPQRQPAGKSRTFSTRGKNTWEYAKDTFKIGDKQGAGQSETEIAYFEGEDTRDPRIFLEFTQMRGPLFEVNVNQFIKHVEATPYQLIWEANKGLLRLIAEYFGFLFTMFFPGVGYFGVFLEVGFTGVLRQVVEQELLDQILGRLSEYSSSSGAGPGSGDFNWLSILLSGKKAGANLAKKVERQVLTDERQAAARMIEGENRAIDSRAADQVEGTAHAADHEQAERLLERRAEVAEAPPTPTRDGSILTVGESRIGVHEQYTDFRIGESRIGAHERSVGAPVEQHGAVTAQEIAALQEAEASLLARKLKLEKELRQKNSNLLGESKQWDFAQENGATQHELERLEQKYDARRKQYDAVEEQLHNLNEELAHVQARIEREFPATAQPLQLRRGIKREPEIAEAFGLGPKNNQTLREKGSDRPGFRPDHVDGNPVRLRWGASYHFREIKDWADMSDTGNLKAMLDYVADPKNKSSLTIYYRSNTKMTGPLREKISDLFFKGKVELVPFVGE